MEHRRNPRFPVEFGSNFSGSQLAGQGNVTDLSLGGCRIECSAKVRPGMQLGLEISLPDGEWPLQVDEATVRWAEGRQCGVEFARLRPDQHERLARLLEDLESGPLILMRRLSP